MNLLVTIPIPVPTWNRILAMHPWQRMQMRHCLHNIVVDAVEKRPTHELLLAKYMHLIRPSKKNARAMKKWKVTNVEPRENAMFDEPVAISFVHYRKRDTDLDNLSVKAVIDGLIEGGVIHDDSPGYVSSIVHKMVKSVEEKTVMLIAEKIEDDPHISS